MKTASTLLIVATFVILPSFVVKNFSDKEKYKSQNATNATYNAANCAPDKGFNKEKCTFNGKPLHGKVKIVNSSLADIKVKIVSSFPDLKVKVVESFPDDCGKWKFVESFPDFTVQFVESFPDITIQFVDSFPGT